MTHMVIYDDRRGVTQYRQFDDLEASVSHLEALHNLEGIDSARLFTLAELEFEVKSYIRVEVGSPQPEPQPESTPVAPIDSLEPELLPTVEAVGRVEASAPIETVESTSIPARDDSVAEPVANGGRPESRRGLFGR